MFLAIPRMLSTLRHPIIWHVGNATRSLGSHAGVIKEIIDRCLHRMRCWLTLAKATCAAEFPSFEIIQAIYIYICMLCYANVMLCHVMFFYVCYVMLCYAMLCYVILCYAVLPCALL